MKALSLSARRSRKCVILESVDLTRRYSPFADTVRRISLRRTLGALCRVLSRAALWSLRAAFSEVGCLVAMSGTLLLGLWHAASVADTLEAQRLIGIDVLCFLPWLVTYFIHWSDSVKAEKGGEA